MRTLVIAGICMNFWRAPAALPSLVHLHPGPKANVQKVRRDVSIQDCPLFYAPSNCISSCPRKKSDDLLVCGPFYSSTAPAAY